MKTIRQMVAEWLKQGGHDGLCCTDMECGCGVDDLMPCDSPDLHNCVPAFQHREPDEDGEYLFYPADTKDGPT